MSRFELRPSSRSTPTSIHSPWQSNPVLVALVVAALRLVTLEDVLERASPRRVDSEELLAVTGPSMKLGLRTVGVLLAEAGEDPSRSHQASASSSSAGWSSTEATG